MLSLYTQFPFLFWMALVSHHRSYVYLIQRAFCLVGKKDTNTCISKNLLLPVTVKFSVAESFPSVFIAMHV
jgi:hypothetical protein